MDPAKFFVIPTIEASGEFGEVSVLDLEKRLSRTRLRRSPSRHIVVLEKLPPDETAVRDDFELMSFTFAPSGEQTSILKAYVHAGLYADRPNFREGLIKELVNRNAGWLFTYATRTRKAAR